VRLSAGVNVGGWLLIEEWMFSNGLFDKVAEWSNEPQGVILPPALPNGFGEYWYSEGGEWSSAVQCSAVCTGGCLGESICLLSTSSFFSELNQVFVLQSFLLIRFDLQTLFEVWGRAYH
jgi:hypothetical protein